MAQHVHLKGASGVALENNARTLSFTSQLISNASAHNNIDGRNNWSIFGNEIPPSHLGYTALHCLALQGPPLITKHPWLQSHSGLSILSDQRRSGIREENNSTRTVCLGSRGAEILASKGGLRSRPWEWICQLGPGRSSRARPQEENSIGRLARKSQ